MSLIVFVFLFLLNINFLNILHLLNNEVYFLNKIHFFSFSSFDISLKFFIDLFIRNSGEELSL